MTYVTQLGNYYAVMIESKGLMGDFPIRKSRSEAVALEYSRKTNESLKKYDKLVERRDAQEKAQ